MMAKGTTKIECTCTQEFRDTHFGHADGCPLKKALDDAYCRGWREGQAAAERGDYVNPELLARVWIS